MFQIDFSKFFLGHSFFGFHLAQLSEHILDIGRDLEFLGNFEGNVVHLADQVLLRSRLPWGGANKDFIENDSNCEYIALGRVQIAHQSLWRHVEGSAYIILRMNGRFMSDSKTKISNFPIIFAFDDIGWFYISVDDISLEEILATRNDLVHDREGLIKGQCALLRKIS